MKYTCTNLIMFAESVKFLIYVRNYFRTFVHYESLPIGSISAIDLLSHTYDTMKQTDTYCVQFSHFRIDASL